MKKAIKIVNILLVAMMVVMAFSTVVMAAPPTADSVLNKMDSATGGNDTGIATLGGNIVNILTTVGIVIAVIVLLILGIKYMMGSASEKAEYKKTMIPYLVGAVLVFGASAIAKAVVSMTNTIASGV